MAARALGMDERAEAKPQAMNDRYFDTVIGCKAADQQFVDACA